MREKIKKYLFIIITITQTVLHYLGWIGILLGIIAIIFKNTDRGIELIIGGISFIVIKYIIGIIFHLINRTSQKIHEPEN